MTPAEELVERTRRAQGLPLVIDDPAVIRKVAAVLAGGHASIPAVERCGSPKAAA